MECCVCFWCQTHVEEMKGFSQKVASILLAQYPDIATAISDAYLPARGQCKIKYL